jgi:nucleoid-associated protein YgaU
MGLEKLTISPEIGGPDITAMFNPEKYTASRGVQYAEIAIPGLDYPVVQFVRGQSEKITLELFFDTTDQGMVDDVQDVREQTLQVYGLMRVNSETHAPPRCILTWGEGGGLFAYGTDQTPWCVVESVSEEFSLFSPSGVPLRAKLNVTFRDAWTIDEQLAETPRNSSDRTKLVRVLQGQTLSDIAWQQYNDPAQWRPIADANQLDNPRVLTAGQVLKVPSLQPGQT